MLPSDPHANRASGPLPPGLQTTQSGSPRQVLPPQPGDPETLGDENQYHVLKCIGEGAFGRVYLARETGLIPREVAIKVLRDAAPSPEARAAFLEEARAAGRVQSRFVCPIFDAGEGATGPYIVMPYVASGTLEDELEREPRPPLVVALERARDIALGLAAAHAANLIHRDLKPSNVLFNPAERHVMVADFGLAKPLDALSSMNVRGTPRYRAPEQWHPESGPTGPLSDVYALGVILYRMLTGTFPFHGDGATLAYGMSVVNNDPPPPSTHYPRVPARVDRLCLRALARPASERFESARAFADELDALIKNGLSHPVPPPLPLPPSDPGADFRGAVAAHFGRGAPTDLRTARALYVRAAAAGHVGAQCAAGHLLLTGGGGEPDAAEARRLFARAAAAGAPEAQYNLAHLCATGTGGPTDLAAARRWYRAAADNGLACARYALAAFDEETDPVAARGLYQSAAAELPEAQHALGRCFELGIGGAADPAAARRWYERAAAAGLAVALTALAAALEAGTGGPVDADRARELYARAAALGNRAAARALERLRPAGST